MAEEYDGLPQIKQGFMGDGISGDDQDLINGMEWYLLLDRHWKETMYAGSLIYKYLLRKPMAAVRNAGANQSTVRGSYAAARQLAQRVPFSKISLNKTEEMLGESVDLSADADGVATMGPARRQHRGAERSRALAQRGMLLEAAQTLRDLESVVVLLDALESWSAVMARSEAVRSSEGAAWKGALAAAHEAVLDAAEPVLGGWLTHAAPASADAVDFAALRAAYLPELVLAYNTVLVVGGQMLSRQNLVRSMDLAALVADEKSGLAACFVRAGRMAELVRALAVSSRFMLKADEAGNRKGRGLRRQRSGEALAIWSVPPSAVK